MFYFSGPKPEDSNKQAEVQPKSVMLCGYLLAFTVLFSFGLGSCSAQALRGYIPDSQLSFFRYLFITPISLMIAKCRRKSPVVNRTHLPWIVINSMVNIMYTIGYYGATVYLPLGGVNGVVAISSLFTSFLISKLMFNRDISSVQYLALAICCVGCVLVIQPWTDIHTNLRSSTSSVISGDTTTLHSQNFTLPEMYKEGLQPLLKEYALSTMGGISAGIYYNIIGNTLKEVDSIINAFYLSLLGVVISLVGNIYLEPFVYNLSFNQIIFLLGHCIGAAIDIITTNYATQMIGSVRTCLVHSLQILVMVVLQYTLMGAVNPGHQNGVEVTGAVVVVIGCTVCPIIDLLMDHNQVSLLP